MRRVATAGPVRHCEREDIACRRMRNMRRWRCWTARCGAVRRAGAASLDYVLVLGVMLPMLVVIFQIGPRIIRLAYEMVCVLVSWPFM
jgi:hypothetical protein